MLQSNISLSYIFSHLQKVPSSFKSWNFLFHLMELFFQLMGKMVPLGGKWKDKLNIFPHYIFFSDFYFIALHCPLWQKPKDEHRRINLFYLINNEKVNSIHDAAILCIVSNGTRHARHQRR